MEPFKDASNPGKNIKVAGIVQFGKFNKMEGVLIQRSTQTCQMSSYIQLTLHFLVERQKDKKDQLFCKLNGGIKHLNSGLGKDILCSLYNYLMTPIKEGLEVLEAESWNQYDVINFGYQTMNCADTENE